MARVKPARQFDWGWRLRVLMTEKRMTSEWLAERAGVSLSMVNALRGGERQGSPEVQGAIADALGEDAGWVFPRTDRELIRAEVYRIGESPITRPHKRRGLEVLHGYQGGEYVQDTKAL